MIPADVDCIGYTRVSTDKQIGETKTSLADQRAAIEALANSLGRTVSTWYADEGISGSTAEKRPGFRRLIADCVASPRRKSHVGYVLVLNDSRWGRFPNPEEAAYWRIHLEKLGWLVRYAENDEAGQNPMIRTVMRAIVGSQASQKRADVQANARRGSRGTAQLGYWGSRDPFGYRRKVVYPPGRERVLEKQQRKAPDEKVVLIPFEEEAAIVRDLYIRYARGTTSLRDLTRWLRTETDRKWTPAAVRFTLTNPAYAGDVVSGRFISDKHARTNSNWRPEAEWVVHRDAHPAIVTRELWESCQQILARNKKWTRRVSSPFIMSGLVLCPCGQPYVSAGANANSRKGRRDTRCYRCVTKASIDACAYPGAVKKEWLEDAVVETLATFVRQQKTRLLRALDDSLTKRAKRTSATSDLERQLTEANASLARLVDAVADGTLYASEARDRMDALRQKIQRLTTQRDATVVDTDRTNLRVAQRERLAVLISDFPRAVQTLQGPALRELVSPWIARAVFDPRDRTLTLDIRHVPGMTNDSSQTPRRPSQNLSRRTVVVGRRKAGGAR